MSDHAAALLCPLEAALEDLMEIELTEDLETPMPMKSPHRCLTIHDRRTLITRLAERRGPLGGTLAEVKVLLDWANQVRWEEKTLRQLLAGEIGVDVTEEGLVFIAPDARRQSPDASGEEVP